MQALRELALPLGLLLASCSAQPAAIETAKEAGALLSGLHAAGNFSGAVIIGRNGGIIYEGAFGTADGVAPFTPDTAADGGSLAKPFTATAIWLLASEGALGVDEPVQTYVPEFPYAGTRIVDLLGHSGGLADYGAFQALLDSGEPVDTRALLNEQRRNFPQPLFAAGSQFDYCNLCFDTLALVIERVSGKSYEDFVRERFFVPAAMTASFLRPARLADWSGPRTLGFRSSLPGAAVFDVFDNEAFYGGGNLYFTAKDLHAWATAWGNRRVLPPAIAEQAMTPAEIGGAQSHLSLTNWYCDHTRERCYYTGHHQAFHDLVYWDAKQNLTVVFVSNSTLPPPLQPWLAASLVALAEGRSPAPQPVLGDAGLQPDLPAAAGRYSSPELGDVAIELEGDKSFLKLANTPRSRIFPIGHGMLYFPGGGGYLSFDDQDSGVYQTLHFHSLFVEQNAARVSR